MDVRLFKGGDIDMVDKEIGMDMNQWSDEEEQDSPIYPLNIYI